MTIYAITDHGQPHDTHPYLTAGKRYEYTEAWVANDGTCFGTIEDDEGRLLHIVSTQCAHLNGNDWRFEND